MTDQASSPGKNQSADSPPRDRLVSGFPAYYGWVIVVAAGIIMVLTSPGQTYSVSIFIERFIEDLGVSRSTVSTLYTMGTLIGSLALPYVGRQIDRRGPRIMVGIIAGVFALACVYMGTVQNALMLGIGFVLIRMLGQGSLSMVSGNVINRWWVYRRGVVMSVAGVATSLLGSGSFPSLIHALIGRFGWRTSYMLLGALVAVVALPVGVSFFRRQPEDYGLLPDGAREAPEASGVRPVEIEEHWTRAEAIRTPAFWIIGLSGAAISALGTGLQFHMVSIFADAGLSAASAAAAFLPMSLTASVVRILAGILIDRIPARYLLSASLVLQAISLFMAPRIQGTTMALAYGVILGATGALNMTVSGVIWAKYFGRRHLGSITGVSSLIGNGGSALGPMPMGIARDLAGSYAPMLTASAIIPLTLAVVALAARRPRKETAIVG